MDTQELLNIAMRATVVYFFFLVVVRLLGKRSVGQATAFDFIVALILGELVGDFIYGDVVFAEYAVAVIVIAVWHFVNALLSHRSAEFDRLTSGEPRELVKDGKILKDALAQERLNEQELWAELRLMSVDKLEEIKSATLEPMGQISVIREDWAKPLEKGDVLEAQKKEKP